MNEAVGTAGFWLGCAIGGVAGYLIAVMRRAWRDFIGAKKLVKSARTNAWRTIPRTVLVVAVIAAISIGLIRGVILNPDPAPANPADAPSSPATSAPSR